MIGVYTKRMRSLNEKGKKVVTAWMDVGFREYVHKLKGARLAVFLVIALHTDEDGWAFPSVKLLAKETGYSQDTVNDALNILCKMTINGHRLLLRFQPRRDDGGPFKSNKYLIFPSVQQQREYAGAGTKHLGHKTGNGYDKRPPPRKEVKAPVMGFSGTETGKPSSDSPMTKNHHVNKNHHTTQSVPAEKTLQPNAEPKTDTNVEPKHIDEKLTGGYVTPNGRMVTPERLEEELRSEKEIDLAPDGYPRASEDFWPPVTPKPRRKQTKVDRQASIAAAMDKYQQKHAPGGASPIAQEWSTVPTYQGQILTEFYKLSGGTAPRTKALRNPATYAAETMYQECGSAAAVIKRLRQFFNERADGRHDFTITGPSSVVKMICAMQEQATGPKVIRVGG